MRKSSNFSCRRGQHIFLDRYRGQNIRKCHVKNGHVSILCECNFVTFFFLKEFQISAFEQRIIQEIEIRILKITYQQLVIEDGEEMVINVAEHEAQQPSFDTPVKNYRILEGMGVTFHCKMAGTPLPKVMSKTR